MKWRLLILIFIDAPVMAAAVAAFSVPFPHPWPLWLSAGAAIVILLSGILYRSVARPLDTVEKGYDLLLAQDFNNRLRTTGEPHADRVAGLFNTMMCRLRVERLKLMEQQGLLVQLVKASPMGVVLLDFDERISMTNPAFREIAELDSDPAELTGHPLSDFSGEVVGALCSLPIGETRVLRLCDTRVYRCSALSFMDRGFPRRFFLVESLSKEVMRAERQAYEKVIRVISHEVNNSMGAIMSLLEMISDSSDDPDMKAVAESSADRCRSLVDFLAEYASVVRLPQISSVECDLGTETLRMEPFLRRVLPDGVSLAVSGSDVPAPVMLDVVMWEQVLVNVVKNAGESIRSAGEEGHVSIRVVREENGRKVMVEIEDDGPGISSEVSQRLFSPFFSTKSEGRGIGLTLVNEILTRHNCRFSLRTTPAPDNTRRPRTIFRIIFPSWP